jgi:hypothetical protein
VTDIFANYSIYDFYQIFPGSSENLQKYYNISFNSKSLIEDIMENVPTSTLEWTGAETPEISPIRSNMNTALIEALDGKVFEVTNYGSVSDECDPFFDSPSCALQDLPDNLIFTFSANYDSETELMHIESEELTTCGNAFSIDLAGGNNSTFNISDENLQLWASTHGTAAISEFTEPCHQIESIIFSVLDIACEPYDNDYGNFYYRINTDTGSIRFIRSLAIFAYKIIEFSEIDLSIDDENFQLMRPFKEGTNPYLQILNLNNRLISLEIYNTLGQQIFRTEAFQENTIDTSKFETGLYFIKLSNLNNQHKTFKILLN